MGAEIYYEGRITFDAPIPVDAITEELQRLENLNLDGLFSLTFAQTASGRALAGLEGGEWGSTNAWHDALSVFSDIARRQQRTVTADARWVSDPGPFRGLLIVDAGSRFHDVLDGDDTDLHRARACACYLDEDDDLFTVEEPTEDSRVTIRTQAAGPFTDHLVLCEVHGECASATTGAEAVFRREQHLLDHHTPRPIPLTAAPALQALPADVRDHIEQAADQLNLAHTHPGPLTSRTSARRHARLARTALGAAVSQDTLTTLLHALIEQTAAATNPAAAAASNHSSPAYR